MGLSLKRQNATRQPQGPGWRIDASRIRGLQRVCLFDQPRPKDLLKGGAITYGDARPFVGSPYGVGRLHGTGSTSDITIPSWTNTTSEATAILVQKRSNTSSNQWVEFGNASNQDHFPFSSLVYTDAFANFRWLNGVALPAGIAFTDYMVVILTANQATNDIRAYINGKLWASNVLSGGAFTLPPSLVLNSEFDGIWYGAFFADRYMTAAEARRIGTNPWQIFYRDAPQFWAAGAGGGGLSIPIAMYHYNHHMGSRL